MKTAFNKEECIADFLRDSMVGAGTNDEQLMRLVLAYAEVYNASYVNEYVVIFILTFGLGSYGRN